MGKLDSPTNIKNNRGPNLQNMRKRFDEMRSESQYNGNNDYSVKCNLIAFQDLFHGKRIKLSTGTPSTTAIRSDVFDAEWHFKAFVKPYYRCRISGGIIWFIFTMLL